LGRGPKTRHVTICGTNVQGVLWEEEVAKAAKRGEGFLWVRQGSEENSCRPSASKGKLEEALQFPRVSRLMEAGPPVLGLWA
jgi:hypothetical protein